MEETNLDYMSLAFEEAKKAYEKNEVPVGAIIVYKDTIIASAYNQKFEKKDTLAHAEIIAIQEAQIYLKTWRLNDCSLYVTLEPCPMCAGAIIQSRISNVFYGAKNNAYGSFGTVVSLEKLFPDSKNLQIVSGVMEEESSKLMKDFFRKKLHT
ncbi:MAG: nucleoside deaminase [Cyanobacteriota bacterium]